ncbi:MAG: hypothetical protein KBD48_00440 [Candidatus Pacebacteria bacterium]|nr:hypothetical protein [Candidatus Paceibacterota bacterium]
MSLYKRVFNYFDKLEDNIRRHLSKYPIIYSILASCFLVLLWRGIWHTADLIEGSGHSIWSFVFHPVVSAVWATAGLLLTGLLVSMFVGDMIIMSGLRRQKKVTEKTEEEVELAEEIEEDMLEHIELHLNKIEQEVKEIKSKEGK